jgi:energy-coupling factor transporter transmembrane protein EcfT
MKGSRMKKNNGVTLYNLIFPIWLLWLFPITWIVVLPANFIIDLLVVTLTLRFLKVEKIKEKVKPVIFKVWIFGFIADFIGTVVMFTANLIDFDYQTELGKWWYENISNAVSYDPYQSIFAVLWVTASVFIAALCIYWFNFKICLKKADLDIAIKKKLSLSLAICTAPYLFYLPTKWFY